MDRLHRATSWGLMLSVFSVAVVAYRNDLSSTRHGCIWSTIEPNVKDRGETPTIPSITTTMLNPQQGLGPLAPAGFSLNCNLRTLNADSFNYTFNREQIEKTKTLRVQCSDKLFFESSISSNQTLFQLRNLKEVQIESCKIRKVPKGVWANLPKLKSLILRTQNTEWRSSSGGLDLEPGAFDGMGNLETLELSHNNIYSFSHNVLCPLRNLQKLNASFNKLSDFELMEYSHVGESGDNFCGLSVNNVDLSFNSIRRVKEDAFLHLRKLTELRLQNNLIGELEDAAFQGLNQLRLLNLSSNRLVAIPPQIFKSNVNLRELYLQNNSISALSSHVFSKLDQLLLLDLSKNLLSSQWVKEDMFQGLIRLIVLKLSYNELSIIDSAIFNNLISLQSLHLQNNKIETINPQAFSALSNLHLLDLSNNRLSRVDSRTFSNLFVLRQLFLDHNKIRTMEDNSLKNCTSLTDLGLTDNLLQEVPVAIRGLSHLVSLDIGENRIGVVSNESFSGLGQLYGLRIVDNKLNELPHGFCDQLKKLRVLNIAQNSIKKISSSAFISCPELRVLRLDSNLLEELPPTLAPQLPSLLWFNVSQNSLKWTNYDLLPKSLEWLDLSHNFIESLTGLPGNVTSTNKMPSHLRVLDVSSNKLKQLDQFSIPSSLETLRVNFNEIQVVSPNTLQFMHHLRRVELVGNLIENLPLTSIRLPQIPSGQPIPEIYLGKNPFICDCESEWLTRVNQLELLRQHPRIMDIEAIECKGFSKSSAMSTKVIPLLEAKPKDFLCEYMSHCFHCNCCEFEFCDCAMTCPDNCSCYHDSSWSVNIVQCSSLAYEQVPAKIPMDASELYLDGNRIFQLESHIFIGKKNLRNLWLNDSHVENIKNKTFNGLRALEVLRLEDNLLSELNGYEFADLESVREIYLHNNMLRHIAPETFVKLQFLQVLTLHGNFIVDYNVWELSRNSYLNSLTLSSNNWPCDCEFLNKFRDFVASKTAIVVDFALAKCQPSLLDETDSGSKQVALLQPTISSMCNSPSNSDITFNYEASESNEMEMNNHISPMGGTEKENHLNLHSASHNDNTLWTLVLCLTAFLIVILVILGIFRQEIYYWGKNALLSESGGGLCSSLFCCCCPGKYFPSKVSGPSSYDHDQAKLFDAYFLYSKKDEDLLIQKIVPELEDPSAATTIPGSKYRLCLHYRDLCLSPDSPWNREMILSAADASKRVVIVLSQSFLQSEWSSSSHFRTSIQSVIGLHQKKLIFILLPDFDQSLSSISSELNKSSSTLKNSCVQWKDSKFEWGKFKRLLPTPENTINLQNIGLSIPISCDPSQLPYNLVMNPNLHYLQHSNYHQNIIPSVPMMRDNSTLPPIPKHQIVLPAPQHPPQNLPTNANGLLNPHKHHHNTIISSIHPIPSQLTPQAFCYNNETFLQQSNHHQNFGVLHHPNNNHNQQPIHFSSQQNPQIQTYQHQHQHQLSVIPPHSHSHTPSQLSNSNFSSVCYPHHHNHNTSQNEQNYSSSAVSSCANDDMDHVYSTLDSPLHSPGGGFHSSDVVDYSPSGGGGESKGQGCRRNNSKHIAQHSTSSGVSSGSDMTCGESSSAVSPSSPIKNGILNKLNSQINSNSQTTGGNNNGKMYFV